MALDQLDMEEKERVPAKSSKKSGRHKKEKKPVDDGKEMSFIEHLEELRTHLVRSVVAVTTLGIALFFVKDWIFETIIFGPTRKDFFSYRMYCKLGQLIGAEKTLCFGPPPFTTQAVGFGEAFLTSIKVGFIAGFIVAFPYVFYEFWRFIRPGLYPKERKAARGVVFVCSTLFLTGVLFGYFMVAPFAISFLTSFTIPGVQNIPMLNSLITYMVMFTLPTGLVFELPVVVYFLARIGLITPEVMREYRKHSIVGILIVAAIITPPDVASQLLVAGPLYVLYEVSIFVARRAGRLHEAEMAGEMELEKTT